MASGATMYKKATLKSTIYFVEKRNPFYYYFIIIIFPTTYNDGWFQLLRQLLQGRLRGGPQDARHLSELLHARDRGVPQDGPFGWYAALLRAPQVLVDVAHLLRRGLKHNQAGPAQDGRRRVRLPLRRAPRSPRASTPSSTSCTTTTTTTLRRTRKKILR